MRWGDVIDLIDMTPGYDSDGFPADVESVRDNIFANQMSVRSAEFYQAAQAGYTVSKVFEVRHADYNDETYLRHNGIRYEILRTYEKGENIELVCLAKEDDHGN